MILGSIVATTLTTLLMMLTMKGASDFGPQDQEQNKSISSSFHYYTKKVGLKNESEMIHFQVPTQLPVTTEVQDLILQDMKEILKMPTEHEEVQDKHLVFQDIRDIFKIATGHEEDAG